MLADRSIIECFCLILLTAWHKTSHSAATILLPARKTDNLPDKEQPQ